MRLRACDSSSLTHVRLLRWAKKVEEPASGAFPVVAL